MLIFIFKKGFSVFLDSLHFCVRLLMLSSDPSLAKALKIFRSTPPTLTPAAKFILPNK